MDLYDRMLNINNRDIEKCISDTISKVKKLIPDTERLCMVASNLIYNDLLDIHIPSKIINTKELGLGYEHEFVLTKDRNIYYLIDIAYEQFLNKGTILNSDLLKNGYIRANNNILKEYLNSIPNTYKIDNIDIDDLYLPNIRSK